MNNNLYKEGDILYTIDVDENLDVSINKVIITSFFYNDLPQYQEYIYSYQGLEGNVVSGGGGEENFFKKEELDEAIENKIKERKDQQKRQEEEAEKFRCPLTGGKITERPFDFHVFDGPRYFNVEGNKIVWKVYPRDWSPRPYHTEYEGKKYVFEYLGDGEWRELIGIEGANRGGKYIDKQRYEDGDTELIQEVEEFLEEQRIAHEKWGKRKKTLGPNLFPAAKQVYSTLLKTELVEVCPLPPPINLHGWFDFPQPERVKITIANEGEYEIEIDVLKKWNIKVGNVDDNLYFCKVGDTSFSIKREDYGKVHDK